MVFSTWLIYTITTVVYIAVLFLFFYRRHKRQDEQLTQFLEDAKKQLAQHKEQAHTQANHKVIKAFELIKRLQQVAEDLEGQAKQEYDQIIEDAKTEKKEIIEDARKKAQEILMSSEDELEQYKEERRREIEKNLVKLVMSVTEKVVERSLTYEDHVELIHEALEEVKQQKEHL